VEGAEVAVAGGGTGGKEDSGSGPGSDSFSDLSDASISKSALEEALEVPEQFDAQDFEVLRDRWPEPGR